jgi:hypothetical protein
MSNKKIIETRGKIDTPYTHIHDCSLSQLGAIKSGRIKLVSGKNV